MPSRRPRIRRHGWQHHRATCKALRGALLARPVAKRSEAHQDQDRPGDHEHGLHGFLDPAPGHEATLIEHDRRLRGKTESCPDGIWRWIRRIPTLGAVHDHLRRLDVQLACEQLGIWLVDRLHLSSLCPAPFQELEDGFARPACMGLTTRLHVDVAAVVDGLPPCRLRSLAESRQGARPHAVPDVRRLGDRVESRGPTKGRERKDLRIFHQRRMGRVSRPRASPPGPAATSWGPSGARSIASWPGYERDIASVASRRAARRRPGTASRQSYETRPSSSRHALRPSPGRDTSARTRSLEAGRDGRAGHPEGAGIVLGRRERQECDTRSPSFALGGHARRRRLGLVRLPDASQDRVDQPAPSRSTCRRPSRMAGRGS